LSRADGSQDDEQGEEGGADADRDANQSDEVGTTLIGEAQAQPHRGKARDDHHVGGQHGGQIGLGGADTQDQRAEHGQQKRRCPGTKAWRIAMVIPGQDRRTCTGDGDDAADQVQGLDVQFHGDQAVL
jgi:hypothetical protein